MFITNPNNQLSSFEDVINAFQKYEDGGFWIKKIIYHLGVFQEAVLGPYSRKEAEETAERWKKLFKFEGKEVAKVLSFKELVCDKDHTFEIDEKWRWDPPYGAGLICIMKGYYKVAAYRYSTTQEKDFERFYRYAEEGGVRKIDLDNLKIHSIGTKKASVFYNTNNVDSYRRGHIMARFMRELTHGEEEYFEWMMDTIRGKKNPSGEKPILMPGYIESLNKECYPIDLDFFKDAFRNEERINKVFKKLWKCTPDDNRGYVYLSPEETRSGEMERWDVIELDIILENDSISIQRMFLERHYKRFNLILSDYEGSFSIGIYDIDATQGKLEGEMTIRLPGSIELSDEETLYISQTLRDGRFFTKIDVIGAVLLFIAKCVGITHVWVDDDRMEECEETVLFINPIRYLANYQSIYANLGFNNTNPDELDRVIEKYQKKKIPIVDMVNEEDVVSELTIESMAKLYLDRACTYENICELLSLITDEINEKISNKYVLNLDEIELSYYKNFF